MENPYLGIAAPVVSIRKHTDLEWTFSMGISLPALPGQFVMVSVPHAGEAPFAVTGSGDNTTDITVRKTGRVTGRLFDCKKGDVLHVRGPYGRPFPASLFDAGHLLVIAGGAGLAAVKMLIESCLCRDHETAQRKLDILAGFRTPKQVLFADELKSWAKGCRVIVTVDTAEGDEEHWAGGIGFVVDYIKHVETVGPHTSAVVVGPPMMMRNTVRELLAIGVAEENVWLSFERHMKCGIGKCGHCRIGEQYVCLDGPVFPYTVAKMLID